MLDIFYSGVESIVFIVLKIPAIIGSLVVSYLLIRYVPVLRDLLAAFAFTVLTGFVAYPFLDFFMDVNYENLIPIYSIFGIIFFIIYAFICVVIGSKNFNNWLRYRRVVEVYKEEVNGSRDLKRIIKIIEEDESVKKLNN